MHLDEAVDDLYALAPDLFVAARTSLVTEARARGDRAGADALRRLPKPSQPAWQVNLLVRAEPGIVTDLASAAELLRSSAEAGDPSEVRRANAARRDTVTRLADRAAQLAELAGKQTSSSTRRDVEATLHAALASPAAAALVAGGQLTAALFDTGLDAVGMLTLAPASARTASSPAATTSGSAAAAPTDQADVAAEAKAALESALVTAREADSEAARTRSLSDQLAEEATQAQARAAAVQSRALTAGHEAAAAAERARLAIRDADLAQSAYDAARSG